MARSAESGVRPMGHPEMGHLQPAGLIMHWVDVCSDPAAHKVTDGPAFANRSVTHRDQLVAVWSDKGASLR
jgi:hypothetical protein